MSKIVEEGAKNHINKSAAIEEIYTYEKLWHQSDMRQKRQKAREAKRKNRLSAQEKYYEDDIPKTIEEYRKQSSYYRNLHNFFQCIIIIGSVIVTSTTGATIVTDTIGLSQWFR